MAELPMKISKEEWKRFWERKGPYDCSLVLDIDGQRYFPSRWIDSKGVNIYKLPGVSERVVLYVQKGIEDLIEEACLDFRVQCQGENPLISGITRAAIDNDGRVEEELLRDALLMNSLTNNGANVIITNQHLPCNEEAWGYTVFLGGLSIISLPENRQRAYDYVMDLTKHEAAHLFGFDKHHDYVRATYDVSGYPATNGCLMLWKVPTPQMCDLCTDGLKHFWIGLEQAKGRRFLK